MLHRVPLRSTRHTELLLCCLLLLVLSFCLMLFWCYTAPNWDVILLHGAFFVFLLVPLPPLLSAVFGTRLLQVEHAGVVVGTLWGKRPLRLTVWQAAQVRHFDWETDGAGHYTLRLLLQRTPAERPAFLTVLHTDSAYQLAAVWRDLELHYPGSGLRADMPEIALPPRLSPRRWGGALAILLALLTAWAAHDVVLHPLRTAATGDITPATITALNWDSSRKGSSYHLEVVPAGTDSPRRSATAFPQTEQMPQAGQELAVLWSPNSPVFYLTGEVLPFLHPLLWGGVSLLLLLLGGAEIVACTSRAHRA